MSRDPFANYDQWLEEPYQRMIEDDDHYLNWCELEDLDPDDPDALRAYEEFCSDYEYEEDYENEEDYE